MNFLKKGFFIALFLVILFPFSNVFAQSADDLTTDEEVILLKKELSITPGDIATVKGIQLWIYGEQSDFYIHDVTLWINGVDITHETQYNVSNEITDEYGNKTYYISFELYENVGFSADGKKDFMLKAWIKRNSGDKIRIGSPFVNISTTILSDQFSPVIVPSQNQIKYLQSIIEALSRAIEKLVDMIKVQNFTPIPNHTITSVLIES